ncbi:thiamine diphosphokinase [Paenibacillus lignilyticus]|uniref:Thiamine diphosphokinase n=1 Tax=Paenibacillus lignilyticus TaxID=1172615 RepID=A0ABS5CBK8_9BACL|nr:thiamine diphosphokinase [Paenibacillus lignilyticus]MBP3963376.1 thiamine diphosphokinase [Paenibacillus lignilyticus]
MIPKRIVIFTGGRLGTWALDFLTPDDMLIGADAGALFLVEHGLKPHIALGDFDSVTPAQLEYIRETSGETHDYDPIDKDYTDTELAWRLALSKKPQQIVMLGALGTRFDHSLANVHLLRMAQQQGIAASIVDEHNCIQLTADQTKLYNSSYTYVSLLPLSERVTGITLTGFQYPLHEASLEIGQSLGISNKLLLEEGQIAIKQGMLLVIQSRD